MVKGIQAAVAELKRDRDHPVTVVVEDMVVELRCKGKRTAADVFRELGPWEGESQEEISELLREARLHGGTKEPPSF